MFFVGIVLAILVAPRVLVAWSQGRSIRPALFVLAIALGLVAVAVLRTPAHFSWTTFPDMVIARIGALIR